MANPTVYHMPLKGTILGEEITGTGALTLVGPVRWKPRDGARINLIKNPSFKVDTTGWAGDVVAITRIATGGINGGACLQGTRNGVGTSNGIYTTPTSGTSMLSLSPSTTYTFSAYVWATEAAVGNRSKIAVVEKALGGGTSAIPTSPLFTLTETPQRVALTFTTNAGTRSAYLVVYHTKDAPAIGDTMFIAATQLEQSPSASPHFDGDSEDAAWIDLATLFSGTPNNSPSVSSVMYWQEEATVNYYPNPVSASVQIPFFGYVQVAITRIAGGRMNHPSGVQIPDVTRVTIASEPASTTFLGMQVGGTSFGTPLAQAQVLTIGMVLRPSPELEGKPISIRIMESGGATANYYHSPDETFTLSGETYIERTVTIHDADRTILSLYGNVSLVYQVIGCYIEAGGVQVEARPYATSLAVGSMGTGYTWAGTANNSASNRSTAYAQSPVVAERLVGIERGSVIVRFHYEPSKQTATGYIYHLGSWMNGFMAMYLSRNVTTFAPTVTAAFHAPTGGGTVSGMLMTDIVEGENLLYLRWNEDEVEIGRVGGTFVVRPNTNTIPFDWTGNRFATSHPTQHSNLPTFDLLSLRREVTDDELALLAATPSWSFDTLDDHAYLIPALLMMVTIDDVPAAPLIPLSGPDGDLI